MNTTQMIKAKAIIRKIKSQIDDSSEAKLMFTVFEQAMIDFATSSNSISLTDKATAKRYLQGEMPHLNFAGVDPDYACRLMKQVDFIEN